MNEPDLQAAAINRHMYLAVTLPAIGPWIVSYCERCKRPSMERGRSAASA